jgi:transcription antitermination factor NusG
VALFPGYVFAKWYGDADFNLVRFCPGVRYAISFGGRLATVEPSFIEALRFREGERGFILPEALETGLEKGCAVKIMAGPLKGAKGVFTGYVNGQERARVLIEILRRTSNVEVPVENLAMSGKISGSEGRLALRPRRCDASYGE